MAMTGRMESFPSGDDRIEGRESYREREARDAWARTWDFFGRPLG